MYFMTENTDPKGIKNLVIYLFSTNRNNNG